MYFSLDTTGSIPAFRDTVSIFPFDLAIQSDTYLYIPSHIHVLTIFFDVVQALEMCRNFGCWVELVEAIYTNRLHYLIS